MYVHAHAQELRVNPKSGESTLWLLSSKVDVVVGIDALGCVLGEAMATALGVVLIPVRKLGKLPVPRWLPQSNW